jgi:L-asparaginase II
VQTWLGDLGLGDDDFRCGPQMPRDPAAKLQLIKTDQSPCQMHNNCSGKHCGFLTLNKHLGAGPDYVDPDHPVQVACLDAFETVTDLTSPAYGIDGCSAPNPATTVQAMARAMAWFASSADRNDTMSQAAWRLTQAMMQHPELVAGENRACTDLMRAAKGRVALKTGAEAYFIAIIPDQKLGVALKIVDGATRASECAITAILVDLGVLDAADPMVQKYLNAPVTNWRGLHCGTVKPADGLFS